MDTTEIAKAYEATMGERPDEETAALLAQFEEIFIRGVIQAVAPEMPETTRAMVERKYGKKLATYRRKQSLGLLP